MPKNPVMKARKQSPRENDKIHYHLGSYRRVKCIRIIIRHAASRFEETSSPTRVWRSGTLRRRREGDGSGGSDGGGGGGGDGGDDDGGGGDGNGYRSGG